MILVSGIPTIVGTTIVILSDHYKVLMNVLITLGAGGGFIVGFGFSGILVSACDTLNTFKKGA